MRVVLADRDDLVAAAWGLPITWDGAAAHLPGGCSDALGRALAHHD